MRRHIYTLVCSVVLLGLCSCGDDDKNGIYPPGYNPDSDNGMCEADGITYELYDGEAWVFKLPSRETVEIPQSVQHNKKAFAVTKIMNSAGNRQVRNLSIPSSIKEIESGAFANTDIKVLYIDDLISWCNIDFKSEEYIGNNSFAYSYACPIQSDTRVFIDGVPITESDLVIPSDAKNINSFAFKNLTCNNIIIQEGVETIEYGAFENSNAKTLTANVREIRRRAFFECKELESVILGEGLEIIESEAFRYCSSLSHLTLPESVKEIHDYVFQTAVFSVINIPSSLKTVGNLAFDSPKLEYVNFSSLSGWCDVKHGGGYLGMPWGNYVNYMFCGESITDVTQNMLSGVETLGEYSFYLVKNIESIELPQGLLRVEPLSLYDIRALKTLIVPPSVNWFELAYITPDSLVMNCKSVPDHYDSFKFSEYLLKTCTLYVPEESLGLYRNDPVYGKFQKIEPLSSFKN